MTPKKEKNIVFISNLPEHFDDKYRLYQYSDKLIGEKVISVRVEYESGTYCQFSGIPADQCKGLYHCRYCDDDGSHYSYKVPVVVITTNDFEYYMHPMYLIRQDVQPGGGRGDVCAIPNTLLFTINDDLDEKMFDEVIVGIKANDQSTMESGFLKGCITGITLRLSDKTYCFTWVLEKHSALTNGWNVKECRHKWINGYNKEKYNFETSWGDIEQYHLEICIGKREIKKVNK